MNKDEEVIVSLIIRLIGKSSVLSLVTLWMCCGVGLGAENPPLLFCAN
jgi:hypothetical protein